ncbi:28S ribosomal protein S15, mitochondrial [Sergentomyia squamirostris]
MSLWRRIVPLSRNSLVRHYAFKPELPIKWVRPEKICCTRPEKSGDLEGSAAVDLTLPVVEYRDCKLLEEADESVKRLFSMESFPAFKTGHHLRNLMREEVQRHPLDVGSMEARIADMTARIRRLQEIHLNHPRNRVMKVYLKELIDKRKLYLKYLRRWDYRRFEWLLEKLNLVYKAHPSEYVLVGRKYAIRKLADKYCEETRERKLLEYRKQLESEQVTFLEQKIKNLEFILNEQKELHLPLSVSQEQIDAEKKRLAEIISKQKSSLSGSGDQKMIQ